jgi:zinc-ribbon domain
MSQMKPYCFKCGAELEPEAIYCPECGRLQRSMVVRAVDPNAPSPPRPLPAPSPGSPHDQPYQFYPDREAEAAEQAAGTQAPQGPGGAAEQHPDQHDPYSQQYPEQDWRGGQHADANGGQAPYAEHGGDQVYAQQDQEQQPYGEQSWPDSYQHGQTGQGYPGHVEPEAAYGQHDAGAHNGQEPPAYDQQEPAYGQHDPAYGQDDPAYGQHDPAYGQQDPAYGQHDPAYGQQDPAYGQQDPAYGQQDPAYGQHDPAYGQHDPAYGQHDPAYGQQDPAYGQQDPAYGQQDPAYGQQDPAYGQHDPAYGQQDQAYDQHDPAYGQHDPAYGQQQPAYEQHYPQPYGTPEPAEPEPADRSWQARAEPYAPPAPPAPIYQQPAPPVPIAPEPVHQPAEPVYRSSAPIPAGSLEPTVPPPSGGYAPPGAGRYGPPPSSNPYALATYEPDVGSGQPGGRSPIRLIALGAAVLLGLFLIAFAAGQCLGGRNSASPSAATTPRQIAQPTTAPSTQPTTAPTATPAPTATAPAGQGITGTAKFARVTSSIPSRCSTSQGCPVEVVLKNNGGSGSGTVTVTLTDDGGNPIATFTGPVPVTDAGGTATVDGFATGDQLGNYLKGGGIVHITTVDVKSGG